MESSPMTSGPWGEEDPTSVPTVVYVDDDGESLKTVTEVLGREGVRVLCYPNPEAAAVHLRDGVSRPGGFLVDGQIPGHDPNEFCRRLRACGIPFLRVTGKDESIAEDCKGVDSAGRACILLRKPVNVGFLRSTVRRAFFPALG